MPLNLEVIVSQTIVVYKLHACLYYLQVHLGIYTLKTYVIAAI